MNTNRGWLVMALQHYFFFNIEVGVGVLDNTPQTDESMEIKFRQAQETDFRETESCSVGSDELIKFEEQFPFKEKHITDTQLKL